MNSTKKKKILNFMSYNMIGVIKNETEYTMKEYRYNFTIVN